MGQKSGSVKEPAKQVVKEIRRATRRQFSAEEKIRIVLTGLRGEDSIAELCRREGIVENLYYRWSKEFLEAGKKRLAGDAGQAGRQAADENGYAPNAAASNCLCAERSTEPARRSAAGPACSSAPAPGAGDPSLVQKSSNPYANGTCFYSNVSATDRTAGGRLFHWCGPEPRALF